MNVVFDIHHLHISDGLPGQWNNMNIQSIIKKDDFWGMLMSYAVYVLFKLIKRRQVAVDFIAA